MTPPVIPEAASTSHYFAAGHKNNCSIGLVLASNRAIVHASLQQSVPQVFQTMANNTEVGVSRLHCAKCRGRFACRGKQLTFFGVLVSRPCFRGLRRRLLYHQGRQTTSKAPTDVSWAVFMPYTTVRPGSTLTHSATMSGLVMCTTVGLYFSSAALASLASCSPM